MRRFVYPIFAVVTTLAGAGGSALAAFGGGASTLFAGLLLHGLAVYFATKTARLRRAAPLSQVERDMVILTGLFVPLVGPAIAWCMPKKELDEEVENSHEAVDRYLSHVKPRIPFYERTLFTGDFERDLARKIDTESYRDVLRHGDTDQKRSALFKLAELGGPHHLALIRSCLEDPDQEVRLYAYGELDRLTTVHEGKISRARKLSEKDPQDSTARLDLARAHISLAISGIIDGATAKFHLKVAAEHAEAAGGLAEDPVEAILLRARALAHFGDLTQAAECLAEIPDEEKDRPEVCLARAEVAFKAREFDRAREEAGRLLLAEVELPGWLGALLVASTSIVAADPTPRGADTPEEPQDEEEAPAQSAGEEVHT